MPREAVSVIFVIILLAAIWWATRDLQRQNARTDVWTHQTYRPVPRRRHRRFRLREEKLPPAPGWDHHHTDYQ